MINVRIPPVLRVNVGGAKEVEVEGSTVGEVIEALVARYPALRGQLLTEDGQLNRFVNVYLDGQDIRYLQERATPVRDGDTVIILPAMAGGEGPVAMVESEKSVMAGGAAGGQSPTDRPLDHRG